MSLEKILCKFLSRKNPQKELQTGCPNGCHCQWLKDYLGDSGPSLVDSSTVAEYSESYLTCLCSVATYGVGCTSIPARAPIFGKGTHPSIPPVIMLQHAIKSLKCITNFTWSTPPYRCYRLLQLFYWWISGLESLQTFQEIFQLCWQWQHSISALKVSEMLLLFKLP